MIPGYVWHKPHTCSRQPVVGITGTGGAGKRSLLDELLGPLFAHFPELTVAGSSGNIFSELLNTVRVATLGQITHALYASSGRYRRSL